MSFEMWAEVVGSTPHIEQQLCLDPDVPEPESQWYVYLYIIL
jgi:hypothetical protein